MNIYLPVLPLKTTLAEQVAKVRDECDKLTTHFKNDLRWRHAISGLIIAEIDIAGEVVDVIQSAAGVLQLLEQRGLNLEGVMVNHRIKLMNRGWLPTGVHNVRLK